MRRALPWLVVLAPTAFLAVWHFPLLPLESAGDYAQYILHAKALVEGRPYGDTGYIFSRLNPFIGPVALPPGLPLTLAPFVAVGGDHSPLLKLVVIASFFAFLWNAARYFTRHDGPWIGYCVLLVTGVALEVTYATNSVLSDLGFAALAWGTIAVFDDARPWTRARVVLAVSLIIVALLYRVAAIALIPAIVLWLLVSDRAGARRIAIWVSLVALLMLAVAAWFNVLPAAVFNLDPASFLARIRDHVQIYRFPLFEAMLYPFAKDSWNEAYHALTTLCFAIGLAAEVVSRPRSFLIAFVAAYGLLVLLAPVSDGRYLWPLYPVIVAASLRGAELALRRFVANVSTRRTLLVTGAVIATLSATLQSLRAHTPETFLGNPDVQAVMRFFRGSDGADSVRVAIGNPRVFTLETGIPAMGLPGGSPKEAYEELERKRISHLVISSLPYEANRRARVQAMMDSFPERFVLEARNGTFSIYRLLLGSRQRAEDHSGGGGKTLASIRSRRVRPNRVAARNDATCRKPTRSMVFVDARLSDRAAIHATRVLGMAAHACSIALNERVYSPRPLNSGSVKKS